MGKGGQRQTASGAGAGMRRGACVLLLALAAPVQAGDLLDAWDAALARDPVLQSAGYARAAAVEARPQALAALLPQLSATASVDAERTRYDALTATASTQGTPAQTDWGSLRGYGLVLNQTLWSGEAFQRLAGADAKLAQAEATYRSAQQALLLRVAQAYFNILSAADAVATNRSEREAFGALLHQAEVRERTGVGPHSDVAQAQSFYDATEQPLIDAEYTLEDARRALAEITGGYRADIAPLQPQIPLQAPQPAAPDDWVAAADEDNFEVRAARLGADAALRELDARKARRLPTLALAGAATVQQQSPAFGPDQSTGSIGLRLNLPLYQGGAIASQIREGEALYQRANAELERTRRATERQTRAAFRGITSGMARVQAAQRAAESGAAAVEASRRNIEFGTGSEFDLLNAQNNYYSAVRAWRQSRYDYLTQVLTLKQQAGRLDEHDLAAIDRLLVTGDRVAATEDVPHVP